MRVRRMAGAAALAATLVSVSATLTPPAASGTASSHTLFAGGFGAGGVVRVSFDSPDGSTPNDSTPDDSRALAGTQVRVAAVPSPTFLVAHPRLPVLYVSSELSGGRRNIRALRPSGATVASTWSGGTNPVRLALNPAGDRLAVANYDGSIALLSVDAAGVPGMPLAIARTTGSGPDAKRQTSSHPHGVAFSDSGRALYVADLGADTVSRYELGPNRSTLVLTQRLALAPGSGPRQIVVDGSSAYVANELSATITTLAIGQDGAMSIERTTALPLPGPPGEVLIEPAGRWMVVLVRGSDVCQVFELTGVGLRAASASPCGQGPRYAVLSTRGDQLLIAASGDGTVRVAAFHPETGAIGEARVIARLAGAAGLTLPPA